jgi:2-polyprenyl-3-methyl-5-hydroxy-6-metoxy-1,4-benzoquinol methylase
VSLISSATREKLRRGIYKLNFGVKTRHKASFRTLSAQDRAALGEFTRKTYSNTSDEHDVADDIDARMDEDRHVIVPWIDAALRLDGARVLEIGCGTGESTVTLAEQGAIVTGIDVDPDALAVGRERIKRYGLEAEFMLANAAEAKQRLAGREFDIVIFFASLEHMTLDEKFAAMEGTWALLRPGGIWLVIEAPNRLWFWDGHTSFENFYNWLPDELASRWAHRSRRQAFAGAFPKDKLLNPEFLARWGRGTSYHEFDLVFGNAKKLEVVSNKTDYLSNHNPILFVRRFLTRSRRYERLLERLEPSVDPGFFRQYLDIIIRKP